MPVRARIATFNLENLSDKPPTKASEPPLDLRIQIMKPQLARLEADILCLQEVHASPTQASAPFPALDALLSGTSYENFHRLNTLEDNGQTVLSQRNLVILSRFPILAPTQDFPRQYKHNFVDPPSYRMQTAIGGDGQARIFPFERPVLHARIEVGGNRILNVLNVHFKSKIPKDIPGQKEQLPGEAIKVWLSSAARAEGAFISALQRLAQALETRILIDKFFEADENAMIAVCGDFNSDHYDVPLEAIRGDIEDTDNFRLAPRVMVPCERTVPESSRFSLYHHGRKEMFDHIIVSRALLQFYRNTEIHNELLHDETLAFATDKKFPESDHAPVVAEFVLPD